MEYHFYQLDSHQENFTTVSIKEEKVIILLNESEKNSGSITFLSNVMKAVGISLVPDCLVVALPPNGKVDFKTIVRSENPKKILLFDIVPAQLNIKFNPPAFHCFQLLNHHIISLDTIAMIQSDKARKVKLWNELKFMFDVE